MLVRLVWQCPNQYHGRQWQSRGDRHGLLRMQWISGQLGLSAFQQRWCSPLPEAALAAADADPHFPDAAALAAAEAEPPLLDAAALAAADAEPQLPDAAAAALAAAESRPAAAALEEEAALPPPPFQPLHMTVPESL